MEDRHEFWILGGRLVETRARSYFPTPQLFLAFPYTLREVSPFPSIHRCDVLSLLLHNVAALPTVAAAIRRSKASGDLDVLSLYLPSD